MLLFSYRWMEKFYWKWVIGVSQYIITLTKGRITYNWLSYQSVLALYKNWMLIGTFVFSLSAKPFLSESQLYIIPPKVWSVAWNCCQRLVNMPLVMIESMNGVWMLKMIMKKIPLVLQKNTLQIWLNFHLCKYFLLCHSSNSIRFRKMNLFLSLKKKLPKIFFYSNGSIFKN